jgi:hypothetical protein
MLGVVPNSTSLRVQISLPTVSSKALAFSSEWLKSISIDLFTREFLIDTVELVSVFLIRNFETKDLRTAHETWTDSLDYLEAEDFNESWDDSFGEFVMGDYSYPASEILFNVDKQAYVNEYKSFTEGDV